MQDHARSGGTALRTAAALLVLLPATATAAEPPPTLPAPPGGAHAIDLPPVAAVAASCPGADGRSRARRRREAVRCLVNHARRRAGLPGFRRNTSLARAATRHARDMARRGYFAHQRAGGPPLARRARRAGWQGQSLGETIGYGCLGLARPLDIVRSWLASPPHAAILLSRDLGQVGVGSARAPMACPGATYVLVAGRG